MDHVLFADTRYELSREKIGNEIFCQVDQDFLMDERNLKGLSDYVPDIKKVMLCILDCDSQNGSKDDEMDDGEDSLTKNATMLYGLIHARYILTKPGLKQMVLAITYPA